MMMAASQIPVSSDDLASVPDSAATAVARLWWAFPILIVPALLIHKGSVLNYLLPAVAFCVAFVFAKNAPREYVRLLIVALVFTPLLRRLADYFGAGFTDPSPILLTPYVVPLAGLRSLRLQELMTARLLPFMLGLLGISYGLLVGMANGGQRSQAVVSALRWAAPVFAGLYLAQQAKARELCGSFIAALRWSTLAGAVYGLIQLAYPPAWDLLWLKTLLESGMGNSYGRPVAFGFRVFGPLNSTGVAAEIWAFGVVAWLFSRERGRALVLAVLCATIFLTLVRTEFLCLPVAIVAGLAAQGRGRASSLRGMALSAAILVGAAVMVAGALPDVMNSVSDRLQTMGDSGKDESMQSRSVAIRAAVEMMGELPFGKGLGFLDGKEYARTPMANPSNASSADLGLVGMFFDLGFLGSAVYLGGVAIVLWRTFRMRLEDPSHEAIIKASLLLVLLHVWSNNPFAAPAALLAWGYAAFAFPLATALSPDAASVPTPQGLPSISGAAPRFSSNDGLLPEEMTL